MTTPVPPGAAATPGNAASTAGHAGPTAGTAGRPPAYRLLDRAGLVSALVVAALLAGAPLLHRYDFGASPAFLVVGLVLGLPHGAVDHLVPAWLSVRARPPFARLALPLAYAAVAAGVLAVFRAAPDLALLGFLAVSVVHFGAADEAFHAERDHRPVRYTGSGVLAHGGPPVVLPLLLRPDAVDPLLAAVAPGVPALLTTEIRLTAALCLLVAIGVTLRRGVRAGRLRSAVEPVLLVALFAAVPPALAIGAYFAGWHSLRHVARLLHADPANHADLTAGRLSPPLRRFARRAALPTLAASVFLAALVGRPEQPVDALPTTIAVLAALTLPHAAVVAWMDRRTFTGSPAPGGDAPARGVRRGPFLYRRR
ncbi:Brp/Blh family beta-carotene 15,15'-dioxygenase [Micromonospora endolithica]|uniref:Brp/Blh family beta-carotene 15,15'-dioxygenase n=1 Tax=Micromonospora endolithica TaxID=230091 RepID=UPI0011ADF084|nr:Brp/Blh family beta-carotene 15,15'-dioxygenase [Micromonospora endolithica]TWJ25936.1 Brp/Blh family beta-carotene 15,15'-monooxygenase [Micromonospora endolithica]